VQISENGDVFAAVLDGHGTFKVFKGTNDSPTAMEMARNPYVKGWLTYFAVHSGSD
jgi:hypothetical protein